MKKLRGLNFEKISKASTNLVAFAKTERLIAFICAFIPLLLYLAEGEQKFRSSISDYVYMSKNRHIFGLLMTLEAMLFIFNGVVYINKGTRLQDSKKVGDGTT
ncbi:MAG: hypothetical protein V3U80_00170 [Flavobacteriaceae bacterium]